MLPLLLLALAAPALGQVKFSGSCPAPTVLASLTAADLTTPTWYEARRYYSWLEKKDYCVNWKFAASGSSYTATTSMRNFWGTRTMTSSITPKISGSTAADFNYVITKKPYWPFTAVPGTYNYQILAMTADYLVAWSCRNHWGYHEQMFWVLTSAKAASSTNIDAALAAASTAGLTVDGSKLTTVQQNC